MENISQWVGIDISKATLDVYLRPMGKAIKVANTKEDISNGTKLTSWLGWAIGKRQKAKGG
ncbi:hypothetical protein MSj_03389 [Microcystis aeruginosa Sj]|uniref:Uncharacterized protein n=1 Tax=Microcystis aeruginosa Sj TaxID=1979544 RepID=A0A2Z6V3Y3_MICAE|nr:hypothetical protein [Microcystis aeruginosa]MDB9414856.1 hypothetical protein [Microcystis aeruginosa CS-567/02]GBL11880.1 hypothetical protein MSj_03389 [Microcystis aeruginosa Sj]